MFNLLVLGELTDNHGRVWKRNPYDLYILEITYQASPQVYFIDGHRDSLSFQMHLWGEIYHLYEALFYFLLKVISTVICFRTTKIQAADFSNFFLQLRVYVHWRSLEEKVTNNNRCQNFSPFNHSDSFFHSLIHSFIHSFIQETQRTRTHPINDNQLIDSTTVPKLPCLKSRVTFWFP